MEATASEIVKKLNLATHPEGGFYSETFRDHSVLLSSSHLPSGYKVDRAVSTAIYFLLPSGNVSHLHRIPCAETWHFYLGEPLTYLHRTFLIGGLYPLMDIVAPNWASNLKFKDIRFACAGVQVLELNEKDGQVKLTCLGSDLITNNQQPQYTVPPDVWFGAFPTKDFKISLEGAVVKAEPRDSESHYSLVGCTCAPAFQFEDFELAKRSGLVAKFPKHEQLISLLTFSE